MQVRQVPFRQDAGRSMPALRAADNNDVEGGASNAMPLGWIVTEKEAGLLDICWREGILHGGDCRSCIRHHHRYE